MTTDNTSTNFENLNFSKNTVTYYLKRLFLLSAKFMDDGVPSGNAVTTDESAIKGCLENL